ncbi:MAG: hypothetical protein KJ908_02555 [Acidobacteria bacterium]|nr:hypothetical protein [Acidobacteriota bacterium]MBU1473265.1 hypothetical protein [Acidobacteriota bacterium]
MMKRYFTVLVVMVGLCLFACKPGAKSDTAADVATGGVEFQKLSLEDAVAKAKARDKLIMVDFYSPT